MTCRLLLLPGMDGTGDLFADFAAAIPEPYDIVTVGYPTDRCLSYDELAPLVETAASRGGPFVLIAESFSTPLAIRFAATNPAGIKGLVLCAGFAQSPMRGFMRLLSLFAPMLFRMGIPEGVARHFLVGRDASGELLSQVRAAIGRVEPRVLSFRLRSVLKCDVRDDLMRITVPVLYLKAGKDRLVPAWCENEIRKILVHAECVEINGPHLLLQREPQKAASVITRFLQRSD
ncbi:MAG TPA: alpha/beta hydrolase [Terracidiphilus sp.]|nr:alpha/beta hydrolase [Terracidiphilus sp.]